MIATIAAIAGKNVQQSLPSCGNSIFANVAITAIIWKPAYMETAQRSKSQRLLNFFGSDRSDHKETSLYSFNLTLPFEKKSTVSKLDSIGTRVS